MPVDIDAPVMVAAPAAEDHPVNMRLVHQIILEDILVGVVVAVACVVGLDSDAIHVLLIPTEGGVPEDTFVPWP